VHPRTATCPVSSVGPCLPIEAGSGAATCPTAPDLASLLGRAPVLSRVTRLQTPPPYSEGLRCCYVSHSSGPRLPTREGSGAAMCPTTLDPTSLLGRASTLSCAP
jgi:hypothetical protein